MGRSLFSNKRAKRKPKIEIIPMVDVMFLLLVFYILSTIAMTIERGIPVSLPEASSSESTSVEEVTITVNEKGEIFLNHDKVALEDLGQALQTKAESMSGGIKHLQEGYVVLNIDMDVPHRQVVGVMNQLRGVGVGNFSIATDSGADS